MTSFEPIEPNDPDPEVHIGGTAFPEDTAAAADAMAMGMAAATSNADAASGHLDNAGDTTFFESPTEPDELAVDSAGTGATAAPAVTPQAPPGSPITEGAPDPSHALEGYQGATGGNSPA